MLGHVGTPSDAGLPPDVRRPILVDVDPAPDRRVDPQAWYATIPLRRLHPTLPLISARAVADGAFEELTLQVKLNEAYLGCDGLRDAVLRALDRTLPPIRSVTSLARTQRRGRNWLGGCWRRHLSGDRHGAQPPKKTLQSITALMGLREWAEYRQPSWDSIADRLGVEYEPLRLAVVSATGVRRRSDITPRRLARVIRALEERLRRTLAP